MDPVEVEVCRGQSAEFALPFECINPCPADENVGFTIASLIPTWILHLFVAGTDCVAGQAEPAMSRR